MGYTVHRILQARILEWVAFTFFRGFSQPRDQNQVPHIAGNFFTSWGTGKPKNAGVGNLSLLQWIFLTQELNGGLLHFRQILYQLSYQGSPFSYASKVILKILQVRLQHHMNWELPDVQAGLWRGRGTRDQIASIPWIMEKTFNNIKYKYLGRCSALFLT